MTTSPRRASVRFHGRVCGMLEELVRGGATRFAYAPAYLASADARPIAPNLPLRSLPYGSSTLHPFFSNLLKGPLAPGSTGRRDGFAALLAAGTNLAGAVEVLPAEGAS